MTTTDRGNHGAKTNGAGDPRVAASHLEPRVEPRRKVRVLFVNDTARNGGPGRSLYYILRFLDTDVIHRSVVLPRPGVISELYEKGGVTEDLSFLPDLVENPFEPWDRAIEREDFDAPLSTKAVRLGGNVLRATRGLGRLTAMLRRGRYDLVYCNGTNADFAGGAVAFSSRVPALWHVRYTSVPPAVRPVHDRLAASKGVRRIVCVSEAAAGLFPHCREKVRVIHNALDTTEFDLGAVTPVLRAELGLPEGAVVFGSQGRILPRKGYVEMTRAADLALRELSDEERARCHFVVLGDTPADLGPDHLAECRELVAKLGLEKNVHFLGFRIDVKPYVADFDVAVVPSVYPDPLPRAVIESMAMGKPVLAFDEGGVREMLSDGEAGTLLPAKDVAALGRSFVRYFRDAALRREQGKKARERVLRDFDARAQARRIQNEIVRTSGLG